MKPIRPPKEWSSLEIYQKFVEQLLKDNPPIMGVVTRKTRRRSKKTGEVIDTMETKMVQVGGYWSRYHAQRHISHFWVYTYKLDSKGRNKVVEIINFDRWARILDNYHDHAKTEIINGAIFYLGYLLGHISVRRVERNYANKQVDFHATSLQPKVWSEEKQKTIASKVIYHTSPDYLRIGWVKMHRLKNEKMYEFKAARGGTSRKGFIQQLVDANKKNPILKFLYKFYPYVLNKKKLCQSIDQHQSMTSSDE